jgi:hypothetical protein
MRPLNKVEIRIVVCLTHPSPSPSRAPSASMSITMLDVMEPNQAQTPKSILPNIELIQLD